MKNNDYTDTIHLICVICIFKYLSWGAILTVLWHYSQFSISLFV